jgi:hypothetical protein
MPTPIDIVGSRAMDLYYTNYKSNSEFWDLDDFIAHCGGVLGSVYQQEYQRERAEARSEKRDEVITFDPNILLIQELEVKAEDGEMWADLECPVMSFPFDQQGIGLQEIMALGPRNGVHFERTTFAAKYQLDYIPTSRIIWFYLMGDKIILINKTTTRLKKIRVFTVPSVNSEKLLVPDGIVEYVITTAAMTIKQGANGVVVKKSSDQNPNKLIQTEADISSVKQ